MESELQPLKLIEPCSGELALQLVLPPECDDLDMVSCNNEYDFTVPDLEITLCLPSLITALNVLHQYPDVLHHVSSKCSVSSKGFEGKISCEYLQIYANNFQGCWYYSFFLNFSNDWSSSVYFFDLSIYLFDFLKGYDDIVSKLEQLEMT
ncbi:hypothetical protein [Neisseria arctica]|uniref:hypothetical protein n=1 Tax=Neisseria arctica TaxID=1470200 RepID=UPI00069C1E59|nr:hypothetical protein [Neisseria arctica]UOO85694.1 hypothetical protein LVJ86_05490 [Neisseria arctica]